MRLDLVAEFLADTAVDDGRYRHPVRYPRLREEMDPRDVPKLAEPEEHPGEGAAPLRA
ncbi:ATP-dependent DNA ligase [Streptomyces sp. NPDC001851]|uniref:ATP-dependent DNA ligase n=1 Tax=Streptomyces sp. NPDC001851 TaxID=3154529 RepID=UPI003316D57A